MDILHYINSLSAKGRFSFTLEDAIADTGKSRKAMVEALRRQIKKNRIALPYRGFYLIISPIHQRYCCLPAEYWIDDLMNYMKQDYYVGLLSAAKYYASAHQKPQIFQVVTEKPTRAIQCGDVAIQFIKNDKIKLVPIRKFNTPAGYISVESPEALMIDLLRYPSRSGGINNIATILTELTESISVDNMITIFSLMKVEQVIMQRLGYLFELIGAVKLADEVEKILQTKKLRVKPLVNGINTKGCKHNLRWHLSINYNVESDL